MQKHPLLKASTCSPGWQILHDILTLWGTFGACYNFRIPIAFYLDEDFFWRNNWCYLPLLKKNKKIKHKVSLWLLVTDLLKSSEALEKKGFYHNWSVWITSVHVNHYKTSLRQRRRKEWLLSSPCVDWGHLGFSLGCSVEMQMQKPEIVGIIGGKKNNIYWQNVIKEILMKDYAGGMY